MNNILDGEKEKVSTIPFNIKRFFQKIKSGIKLGWAGLKMMPRDKIYGGIFAGIFFFWGLGDFIHLVYQWILVYHWIGYILIGIIPLLFIARFIYWIYKGIANYFYYKKMARVYKKLKDAKEEQNFSRRNILDND